MDEIFDQWLAAGVGVRKVRLKSEYYDASFTDRIVPANTEGFALYDGSRRGWGEVWKVKVEGQPWGDGWITMPERELEFLN